MIMYVEWLENRTTHVSLRPQKASFAGDPGSRTWGTPFVDTTTNGQRHKDSFHLSGSARPLATDTSPNGFLA
jgi:hypothetical protein